MPVVRRSPRLSYLVGRILRPPIDLAPGHPRIRRKSWSPSSAPRHARIHPTINANPPSGVTIPSFRQASPANVMAYSEPLNKAIPTTNSPAASRCRPPGCGPLPTPRSPPAPGVIQLIPDARLELGNPLFEICLGPRS